MLINHSNHQYQNWSNQQKASALALFDVVIDFPFPNIDPSIGIEDVKKIAIDNLDLINVDPQFVNYKPDINILIAGEQSYIIIFYTEALKRGYNVYIATSERKTAQLKDGSKHVTFEFVKFRIINT